jgi:alkaline phosphatase
MPSNQPLFASDRRDSSTNSDDRAAAEDTALLGSQRQDEPVPSSRARFWREIGLFTWALVATAAVLAVFSQHQAADKDGKKGTPTGKRNLIFMVSDGMGPASLSMTRSFRQFEGTCPPSH